MARHNQHTTMWTPEKIAFLTEHYPSKGKMWCVERLGMLEHQVRSKASRLRLKARGISEASKAAMQKNGQYWKGKKRPEQAAVMLAAIHSRGLHMHDEKVRAEVGAKTAERIRVNGHPKGALGMKHSDAAKSRISANSKEWQSKLTPEQKMQNVIKSQKTKAASGTNAQHRPQTTWKAGWREIGGQRKYFRSRWEANYARYLQFLVDTGNIASWQHEPHTFWFEGVKRGAVSYLPDFLVTECGGSTAYHEVKGWMDDRSKTKIRRMAKYHPTVKLIVIDAKAYRELARKLGGMIQGWESEEAVPSGAMRVMVRPA